MINREVEEKRFSIRRICSSFDYCISKCSDECPFSGDKDAWCTKGFVEDIPIEDLDHVLQRFHGKDDTNE